MRQLSCGRDSRTAGLTILILCSLMLLGISASAAVITIPDDYPTIQAGVDTAQVGDTVQIRAGTYLEQVTIEKRLCLRGMNADPLVAVIDGGGGGGSCLTLNNASDVRVENLVFQHDANGLMAYGATGAVIENCAFLNNTNWGLRMDEGSGMIVRECMATGNGQDGIKLHHVSNAQVTQCTATLNSQAGIKTEVGSSAVTIDHCLSSGNDGIGISLDFLQNGQVSDCTLQNNGLAGILLNGATGNTITQCDMTNNHFGLYATFHATGNTMHHNYIAGNHMGININGPGVQDLVFYANDILANDIQVYDNPDYQGVEYDQWDGGYPTGGNYWGDYTGEDHFSGVNQDEPGSDGFGDTPYPILGMTWDHYPLIGWVIDDEECSWGKLKAMFR